MTPVATLWWLRPVSSAARVGEHSVELRVAEVGLRQAVHGGGRNRPSERGRCAEAHVVGEDEQDVRRALRGGDLHGKVLRGFPRGAADLPLEGRFGPRENVLRPLVRGLRLRRRLRTRHQGRQGHGQQEAESGRAGLRVRGHGSGPLVRAMPVVFHCYCHISPAHEERGAGRLSPRGPGRTALPSRPSPGSGPGPEAERLRRRAGMPPSSPARAGHGRG